MSAHPHAESMTCSQVDFARTLIAAIESGCTDCLWEWDSKTAPGGWRECGPKTALAHLANGYLVRRKPKTSRERFEEWARRQGRPDSDALWQAWSEGERQAKEQQA